MNEASGGRIKVGQDRYGTVVYVPREEDPSQHDVFYVNKPGMSLNDWKKFGADVLWFVPVGKRQLESQEECLAE